jgi:hypothetical protein
METETGTTGRRMPQKKSLVASEMRPLFARQCGAKTRSLIHVDAGAIADEGAAHVM